MPRISLFFNWQKNWFEAIFGPSAARHVPELRRKYGILKIRVVLHKCKIWHLHRFSICQQIHKKYLDQVDVECEIGSKVVWNLVGLNFGAILEPKIIRSTNDLM